MYGQPQKIVERGDDHSLAMEVIREIYFQALWDLDVVFDTRKLPFRVSVANHGGSDDATHVLDEFVSLRVVNGARNANYCNNPRCLVLYGYRELVLFSVNDICLDGE